MLCFCLLKKLAETALELCLNNNLIEEPILDPPPGTVVTNKEGESSTGTEAIEIEVEGSEEEEEDYDEEEEDEEEEDEDE